MKIKLTIEYDGANYFGWQLQSGQDSIQARIESALERIFSQPVRVYGSGRTDAGVHALGQVAAITLPRPFAADELNRAMNALLPPDIVVLKAEQAPDTFDPRRDALSRVYEYHIVTRPWPSAFDHSRTWHLREALALDPMREAARLFLGEHDFAAFRTLGSEEKSTVRRIIASAWRVEADRLIYRVEGTSFMRHMVRTMVAAMVEIGRGKHPPEFITELLASRDRAIAPAAAPPGGLFLVEVKY